MAIIQSRVDSTEIRANNSVTFVGLNDEPTSKYFGYKKKTNQNGNFVR